MSLDVAHLVAPQLIGTALDWYRGYSSAAAAATGNGDHRTRLQRRVGGGGYEDEITEIETTAAAMLEKSDYYHDPGYGGGGGYGDLQTGHTRGGAGHAMVICLGLLSAVGAYLYMFYQREPYVDPYAPQYQTDYHPEVHYTTGPDHPGTYLYQYLHSHFDHLNTHHLSTGYGMVFMVVTAFAVCATVIMAWLGLVANNPKGHPLHGGGGYTGYHHDEYYQDPYHRKDEEIVEGSVVRNPSSPTAAAPITEVSYEGRGVAVGPDLAAAVEMPDPTQDAEWKTILETLSELDYQYGDATEDIRDDRFYEELHQCVWKAWWIRRQNPDQSPLVDVREAAYRCYETVSTQMLEQELEQFGQQQNLGAHPLL